MVINTSVCLYQVVIPLMTGREAVHFFASCNHNGKIKSLYFNLTPSRHFAPYDLISVPKAKVSVVAVTDGSGVEVQFCPEAFLFVFGPFFFGLVLWTL